MPRRDLLKANLFKAWQRCIGKDYCSRRINSERSLQASFWAQLNEVLPESRRMFIEPAVRAGEKVYFPDLLICNSREVIGVVELKYTPRRVTACIDKDIRTLCALATFKGPLSVSNHRHWGPATRVKTYRFSKHVVFAWAGVHREGREAITNRFSEMADSNGNVGEHSLFQLHAVAETETEPDVFSIPSFP